ncbi:hypothetical protein [Agriterribacter sp.]|uniref:hypothetical protein n=1 Tax=Agriterribacter sp. TaxID=2821509 RepID=UPI002CA2E647|nr:hypothetical protein [Agriterribacter sp.]HTN07734.1 hypothetical protein [Agriterribacter sp.]
MRLLKQAVIGLIAFSMILLFFSFLLPSKIRVSKSVLVHASHDSVMAALLHMERWKQWNPILQDSTAKYSIPSPRRIDWVSADGVPNSIQLEQYAHDSIIVIIRSKNKQVFSSGFTVVSHQQDSLLTKVEWWINEDIKWYPWEKFYGLFAESFRETYMDNNLQLFKHYIENK